MANDSSAEKSVDVFIAELELPEDPLTVNRVERLLAHLDRSRVSSSFNHSRVDCVIRASLPYEDRPTFFQQSS